MNGEHEHETYTDLNGDELPTAYKVAEMSGRFYAMRFGLFRLDGRGFRITARDALTIAGGRQL